MIKQNRNLCERIEGLTEYNQKFKNAVKPCLLKNSDNHCSYCDERFESEGNLIIEHFKSRAKFPEFSADYNNLYAACFSCNNRKRDENYPEQEPLRPDTEDYCFAKNFYFVPRSGELLALNNIAQITIDFLNLNNIDVVKARRNFLKKWNKCENKQRPSSSYRFIELIDKK